jgi:hypothetical protein
VDIIFLYVTTYALSSIVLPVLQRAKVPVIILNLAPEAAIDYASWIFRTIVYHLFQRIVYQLFSPKFTGKVYSGVFISGNSLPIVES